MSTTVALTGVGVSTQEVAHAVVLGEELARWWERLFSRFRADSQLSRLNAANGQPIVVDDAVIALLDFAAHAVEHTGGRFDPSILPALEAVGYDRSIEQIRLTSTAWRAPRPAAGLVGWRRVRVDRARREVMLPAGMRLDFGGLAKGAFVDRLAMEIAEWPGGCVDAGGDLRVWGIPPDGERWVIGVEDPTDPGHDLMRVEIAGAEAAGVATSATNRRRWLAGGKPVHHLINPRTGVPLAGQLSAVTVFAASVAAAEVATKALMVAGNAGESLDPGDAALAILVFADRPVRCLSRTREECDPFDMG